jgi:excisionase family DNA binding protein
VKASETTTGVAPLVYSVDQAAAALGIGRNAIYEEMARGRLKSFKHGNRRRIARVDLVAFVDLLRSQEPEH